MTPPAVTIIDVSVSKVAHQRQKVHLARALLAPGISTVHVHLDVLNQPALAFGIIRVVSATFAAGGRAGRAVPRCGEGGGIGRVTPTDARTPPRLRPCARACGSQAWRASLVSEVIMWKLRRALAPGAKVDA